MPFQKGQSGNPAGRPPKVVENAEQSVLLRLFDGPAEEAAVTAMIREARKGNVAAFKELMDRKYGKVKDVVEHGGEITVKGYARVSPDDWDADAPDRNV